MYTLNQRQAAPLICVGIGLFYKYIDTFLKGHRLFPDTFGKMTIYFRTTGRLHSGQQY